MNIITRSSDFLKFYQRPNPNNVTGVQPKAYDLFVAHHKYVSVHLGPCSAYDYKISCCLQARKQLNNIFTIFSGTNFSEQYYVYHFEIDISKGCKFNLA